MKLIVNNKEQFQTNLAVHSDNLKNINHLHQSPTTHFFKKVHIIAESKY
jgi:hypothetical protein